MTKTTHDHRPPTGRHRTGVTNESVCTSRPCVYVLRRANFDVASASRIFRQIKSLFRAKVFCAGTTEHAASTALAKTRFVKQTSIYDVPARDARRGIENALKGEEEPSCLRRIFATRRNIRANSGRTSSRRVISSNVSTRVRRFDGGIHFDRVVENAILLPTASCVNVTFTRANNY